MIRLVNTQIKILLNQKGAKITFYSLIIASLINFYINIFQFSHIDRASVPNITEFCIWSGNNIWGWYVINLICFLLVLPGGISFAIDKKTKIDIYMIARSGGKNRYITSKILAVFVTTFICVAIPFIIELMLNICAFPVESTAKMQAISNILWEEEGTVFNTQAFMFNEFMYNPIVYCLVRIVLLSLFAASLALIPMALSCVCNKFYAYLMIPVYFLLAIFQRTRFDVFGHKVNHNYFSYLLWNSNSITKTDVLWFYILVGGVASIAIIFCYESRREV